MVDNPFEPTHRISVGRYRRILVKLVDGACYTRVEWDHEGTADWEWDGVNENTVTFQEERKGIIRPIR